MESNGRKSRLVPWVCALYALATTAWFAVWYHTFAERSGDEATFENMLWNAAHGNGLRSFIESHGVPHLAVHFSPALELLVPLYALLPSMHIVHFVVAAFTAGAGWALFRRARVLGDRNALLLLLAFLLLPTVVLQTFMEFHEQALAILPLTLLLFAWRDGARLPTLAWSLAFLSIREDNALLVLALGALSLITPGRRGLGAALVALAVAWLGAWLVVGVRGLGGGRLPSILGGTYGTWGTTPRAILAALLGHPLAAVRHVLAPVPLGYLALLLGPFLLVLPFGSPLALVALPHLLMVLLADYGTRQFQIRMHFSLVPVVVFAIASLETLIRMQGAPRPRVAALARRAPAAMLVVVLLLAPAWVVRAADRLNPWPDEIREVLKAVPDTASVTAPMYLLNHLARRPRIALEWDDRILDTEYVLLEDSSRFFFHGTTMDIFQSSHYDSLLTHHGYREVRTQDGWHVYHRESASPPR